MADEVNYATWKQSAEVHAFRWSGGPDQRADPVWAIEAIQLGRIRLRSIAPHTVALEVDTPTGTVAVQQGDWVIRNEDGELYTATDEQFSGYVQERLTRIQH